MRGLGTGPLRIGSPRGRREVSKDRPGRGREGTGGGGGERPMGPAAFEGEGVKGRARVSGERPIGATLPTCRQQHHRHANNPPIPLGGGSEADDKCVDLTSASHVGPL